MLSPGDVITGQPRRSGKRVEYEIIRRTSSGELENAFLAMTSDAEPVSVRTYSQDIFQISEDDEESTRQGESLMRALLEKAKTLNQVRGDHLPRFKDLGVTEDLLFIITDHSPGQSLREIIDDGGLTSARAFAIAQEIAKALADIHAQGFIHGRLTPESMVIRDDNVVLTDLGITRFIDPAKLTGKSSLRMYRYLSPEALEATSPEEWVKLGGEIDVYSIGVILYELLFGETPFADHDRQKLISKVLNDEPVILAERRSDMPENAAAVVMNCLEKLSPPRYRSPQDLSEAIAALDLTQPEAAHLRRREAALVSPSGYRFQLKGDRILIGRADPKRGEAPDIDLTPAEPLDPQTGKPRQTVHREQALMILLGDIWAVEALPGKDDRAWLNGSPMRAGQRCRLRPGDRLKFGAVELEFRAT